MRWVCYWEGAEFLFVVEESSASYLHADRVVAVSDVQVEEAGRNSGMSVCPV
jgi:hypothetical protein